jgi:CYTH domain-containing protein
VDFDQSLAAKLGFPKTKYMAVERERRWLCRAVPHDRVLETHTITDLYITSTQLRLREARAVGGGEPMLRLTRKVDVGADTRLLTSIYLTEHEFALIASAMRGSSLKKKRHTLKPHAGVAMSVDEFQGALDGLILAEAEFDTVEAMKAFAPPDFVEREVTKDLRYGGGALAVHGFPPFR